MLVFDRLRHFDGTSISVPLYHRGHLSLFPRHDELQPARPGTRVWMCLLPGKPARHPVPELVMSPVHWRAWSDVWDINLTVRERHGVVNDLLETLQDCGLNILVAESSCMEEQRWHTVEIVADAEKYHKDDDLSSQIRSRQEHCELNSLHNRLLALFATELDTLPDGNPRLRIRRVQSLWEHQHSFYEAQQPRLNSMLRPFWDSAEVVEGKSGSHAVVISLSRDIQAELLKALNVSAPEATTGVQYLVVSDTRDRFLRVYFFEAQHPIIPLQIVHKEKVGAIAAITRVLRCGGYNILTSLSRLYEHDIVSATEFVLEPPETAGSDAHSAFDSLLQELSTNTLVNKYEIAVVDFRQHGVNKPLIKLSSARPDPPEPTHDPIGFRPLRSDESVEERLAMQLKWFEQQRKEGAGPDIDLRMIDVLRSTLRQTNAEKPRVATLFVSYPFKDKEAFDKAERLAKDIGFFEVKQGKALGIHHIKRDGLIDRICECTHFIGLWTDVDAIRSDRGLYPSTWLPWELGIAHDRGLSWQIVVHADMNTDTWQIVSEKEIGIFQSREFDDVLARVLRTLYLS